MNIKIVLRKNIKKIFLELGKLNSYTKIIIGWGSKIFLMLFAIGAFLMFYNKASLNFSSTNELIATSIIKASFTIFAEAIVGGLFMDYAFNRL